jgi:cell division protein FtsL
MTFIQPTKHINILNAVIALLVVALLGGTFWLVIAYNKTVDLSHDIVSLKAKLDTVGAQNTALNNQVLATLGGADFTSLAASDGLVQDKNPQYFTIDQQWPIASQQ